MHKNVLVTLADNKHIEHAKQLFASAYFKGGWAEDFLLITYKTSKEKLRWFRNKGIYVIKCKPLFLNNSRKINSFHYFKAYLFSKRLKNWQNVIYLDTDILVRASLSGLTKVEGFAAAPELDYQNINYQFDLTNQKYKHELYKVEKCLGKKFDLKELAFNSGVMAFNTKIIKDKTFSTLVKIFKTTKNDSRFWDQGPLNLFFYKSWTRLSRVYNFPALFYIDKYKINYLKIPAIILHFAGSNSEDKPWVKNNNFFEEWIENYKKANMIDINKRSLKFESWSFIKVLSYEALLRTRIFIINNFF